MEFLTGLIGTLVGAFVVFVSELWRQVLNGKAAARLIYVESHQNALLCDWAADGHHYSSLSDRVWQSHSVHVIPLLTNEASQITLAAYFAAPETQQMIQEVVEGQTEAGAGANSLKIHSLDFQKAAYWMYEIENKSRLKLLFELLRGRPALPSADEIEYAIAAGGAGIQDNNNEEIRP
jgi:hypothetical protein